MESLKKMIIMTGGEVDGIFVTKPGCQIINHQQTTTEAAAIFETFNIDIQRPLYEQNAEFNSRLTFFSFKKDVSSSEKFNRDMVEVYKHHSVYGNNYVTFLIAGITIETILELVSTREARVSRLTSSKTKAMSQTLYRIFNENENQKQAINEFVALKNIVKDNFTDQEESNMFNLGLKVGALTFCMNLKDFHTFFIGRMSPNNEKEVIELCELMVNKLRTYYPLIIKEPAFYKKCDNGTKFESN